MKKSVSAFLCTLTALSFASCGTPFTDVQTETVQSTTAEAATEITETETTTSAETTTTTEETTVTVTETEKVCPCESEFQHYCCEYLNDLDYLTGGVYYGDINGDDKPEAVIEISPFEWTCVLYENEHGMQELTLEPMSFWGWEYVCYIADTKQILFRPPYGHPWSSWGYEGYYLYGWNGSDYEVTSSILRESGYYYEDGDGGHTEYGQAYIDGENVDNDTFEVKLAEYEKLRDENDYFPIIYIYDKNYRHNPNPETYKNYIKENFPCFDNWDIIPETI